MTALSILAQDSEGGGGGIVSLLVLLLIPFAMYFLLIRPQRKRMKAQVSMQASLGVGDEVIMSSGVYGFITGEEADLFWVEIDDDVQIRVAKAAIQGKVSPDQSASGDDVADGATSDKKKSSAPAADQTADAAAEVDDA
jgi:preprotein translocase subunit YajC